ncbi:hypothetical protein [Shewanella surugensis]|uniref:Uncharacterized protein n=1 Tax=Shewanella surugensis TaxID=212020 RepID=A0ABT0LB37_9GAMM|nr:hypothetical protein [Shewanella surugensis]MCL1124386.1 hypothetical protein [Shewanella surugensis]
MGFSRKKWNNIIIIASLVMVSVLSLIDDDSSKQSGPQPSSAQTLFDDAMPLVGLKLGTIKFEKVQTQWHCSPSVFNCQEWAETWKKLSIISLKKAPKITATPQQVTLYIDGFSTPQVWLLLSKEGLLKSPKGNWYKIPAQSHAHLLPQLDQQKRVSPSPLTINMRPIPYA